MPPILLPPFDSVQPQFVLQCVDAKDETIPVAQTQERAGGEFQAPSPQRAPMSSQEATDLRDSTDKKLGDLVLRHGSRKMPWPILRRIWITQNGSHFSVGPRFNRSWVILALGFASRLNSTGIPVAVWRLYARFRVRWGPTLYHWRCKKRGLALLTNTSSEC